MFQLYVIRKNKYILGEVSKKTAEQEEQCREEDEIS